jgi:DNA-binding GntR family transcriptional regulator
MAARSQTRGRRPPARKTESLAERAYIEIRDRLVTLDIPPGAAIDEDELMAQHGLGRTPVREAIKRLQLENLIDVFPRRGTFAADIHLTDLAAISDLRGQLEGYAAGLAAERLAPAAADELAELLEELNASVHGNAPEELMALDAKVHRFVYRNAGNEYLEEALARLLNLSMRIWYLVLDRLPDVYRPEEHIELLEAIGERDSERARAVAQAHVASFAEKVRSVI